jgi:flagellar biosynthetic protein FliP
MLLYQLPRRKGLTVDTELGSSVLGEVASAFEAGRLSSEVETFILISALSFIPLLLVAATAFTRYVIVFSFLRSALGLQQTPPNLVIITLAMFLTLFTMKPVFSLSYDHGLRPYLQSEVSLDQAAAAAWRPFRNFMISQTTESDIALVYRLSRETLPKQQEDISSLHLIPAFMLSELKIAFKIGFIIYLPFLLIDIVLAAILMSLGMIMVPPVTLSLPLKIMLFVVIDGWGLISETLIRSVTG